MRSLVLLGGVLIFVAVMSGENWESFCRSVLHGIGWGLVAKPFTASFIIYGDEGNERATMDRAFLMLEDMIEGVSVLSYCS